MAAHKAPGAGVFGGLVRAIIGQSNAAGGDQLAARLANGPPITATDPPQGPPITATDPPQGPPITATDPPQGPPGPANMGYLQTADNSGQDTVYVRD